MQISLGGRATGPGDAERAPDEDGVPRGGGVGAAEVGGSSPPRAYGESGTAAPGECPASIPPPRGTWAIHTALGPEQPRGRSWFFRRGFWSGRAVLAG